MSRRQDKLIYKKLAAECIKRHSYEQKMLMKMLEVISKQLSALKLEELELHHQLHQLKNSGVVTSSSKIQQQLPKKKANPVLGPQKSFEPDMKQDLNLDVPNRSQILQLRDSMNFDGEIDSDSEGDGELSSLHVTEMSKTEDEIITKSMDNTVLVTADVHASAEPASQEISEKSSPQASPEEVFLEENKDFFDPQPIFDFEAALNDFDFLARGHSVSPAETADSKQSQDNDVATELNLFDEELAQQGNL